MIIFGILGFICGYVTGTVAMGWGAISVPALILLGVEPSIAIGTSLLARVVVAFTGGLAHHSFGNVKSNVFLPLFLSGVLGAFLGSIISMKLLPTNVWKLLISLSTLTMGIIILTRDKEIEEKADKKTSKIISIGLIAGFCAGAFGTGWGPVGVTLLTLLGVTPHTVIGSSLLARTAVSLTGGLTYFAQLGEIFWNILIPLSLFGIFGVISGAKTSNMLPPTLLRKIIGFVVIALGISVLIKTIV